MISFDEISHTYKNNNGENYTSVTTLINNIFPEFQKDMIAYMVAKKRKTSPEVIIKEWEDTAKNGTRLHKKLENEIETLKGIWINQKFFPLVKSIEELKTTPQCVLSEMLLFSHKYKIAGTSDLVVRFNQNISIMDFKTGIKTETLKKNYTGKAQIINIKNSKFNRYSLQTSIYAVLLKELLNGFEYNPHNNYIIPIDNNSNIQNILGGKILTEDYSKQAEILLDSVKFILNNKINDKNTK